MQSRLQNTKKIKKKKEGNRVFFIAVLMAAIAFGPIGLLLTLLNTKRKPF
jgi:hypothetical protein